MLNKPEPPQHTETNMTKCYSSPFWSYIVNHISHFLLTLNASACGIIYCVMCRTFRTELLNQLYHIFGLQLQNNIEPPEEV